MTPTIFKVNTDSLLKYRRCPTRIILLSSFRTEAKRLVHVLGKHVPENEKEFGLSDVYSFYLQNLDILSLQTLFLCGHRSPRAFCLYLI